MKSATKPGFAKAALAAAALSALLPFGAQAASQLQTAATGGAGADLDVERGHPARSLPPGRHRDRPPPRAPWSWATDLARPNTICFDRAGGQPGQRRSAWPADGGDQVTKAAVR